MKIIAKFSADELRVWWKVLSRNKHATEHSKTARHTVHDSKVTTV